jgi:hypothetical protein
MTPTADDRETRAGLGDERRAEGDVPDAGDGSAPPSGPTNDQEEIRRRAYERYLARGPGEGNEIDDWLAAERELTELRTVPKLLHLPGHAAVDAAVDAAGAPRPPRATRARPRPPEQRA